MRLLIEILNAEGRVIARSPVGEDSVRWVVGSNAFTPTGFSLRARVLEYAEPPEELERLELEERRRNG